MLLLAALLALLSGSALTFTSTFPPRLPTGPTDPHAKPLDFAARELREALGEYATLTLPRGLPPIDSGCIGPREIYRAVRMPSESPGPIIAVDIDASGTAPHVTTWLLTDSTSGGLRWKRASDHVVDAEVIDAVRSSVENLLRSNAVAATGAAVLDAPEEVVETCRHARYHFYRRIGDFAPADEPFRFVVRSFLALSPQHVP